MAPQLPGDQRTSLLAHTDFGSLTLLWNILGGLQILPPIAGDSDPDSVSGTWQFVLPETGYAVVNIGDALVSFTNGVLRSNVHRVTAPPSKQAEFERYSAGYFMRTGDEVIMRPLGGGDVILTGGDEGEGGKL
jgi:isopenicillin N synthase-like dioxygenase